MSTSYKKTIRKPISIAWVCLLFAIGSFARTQGADDHHTQIADVRTTIEKWIETRRALSKEKQDWKLAQEMLNERIDLVQREIDSVRGKIKETEQDIGKADEKRAELVEKNETLKKASSALEEMVVEFEARTRGLLKRLPDPIRKQVKPLSQRFPDDPNDTKLSLSERFQNVVGILNEVNKFNGVITVTSEVRELDDGSAAEVTAMYIGIGKAYYANAASEDGEMNIAGIGTASPGGWTWKSANDAADDIRRAIAIYKNEEVADFVRLPVEIQQPGAATK